MNEAQIEYELKRKKADLAFWIEHKSERVVSNDGGMIDVCDMKIASARERIGDLKRMLFAIHCNEQV
jgi:hypothetical protein